MKDCYKRNSHISTKVHIIYIFLTLLDTPLLRTSQRVTQLHFTPLHYTCRHFTSCHLNFTQLHFTTLSFSLTPSKFPTAPFHLYWVKKNLMWRRHPSVSRDISLEKCIMGLMRKFGRRFLPAIDFGI
jgi:hypothetical protein